MTPEAEPRPDDVVIWAILAMLGIPLWLCALGIHGGLSIAQPS